MMWFGCQDREPVVPACLTRRVSGSEGALGAELHVLSLVLSVIYSIYILFTLAE